MLASAANDVLDMILQNDQYAFATGAWFMEEICSDDVKASLANDPDQGWEGFMKSCVYAPMSEDRRKYWNMAKAAFGSEVETTEPVPEEGGPTVPKPPITAAPVATPTPTTMESGTVIRRRDTRDSSAKPGLLSIPREEFDKFKDIVARAKNESSGLKKPTEDASERSLRQRDFSSFLDVMFGNRMDTICTEPDSEPPNEENRAEMSASTLSLIETIASCSGGEAKDEATCDNLPSSFSKQPSPLSLIDSNTTLTYHQACLSILWLNLYVLRPTKMLAPFTKKIFNSDPIEKGGKNNNTKTPILHPSDLIQCTYLSSLQELGPYSLLVKRTKRSTPTSTSFTRRRNPRQHYTTHLRHRTIHPLARLERQKDVAQAERVAVITRWVDDTCAAGVREELYSEEDMARWCDEVGKAVRVEEGAARALETFEGWVEVI